MRVAAIDVGTNTTRLLVAESAAGGYRALDRRLLFTRLGEGVDRTRRLAGAPIERTLRAIAELCAVCGEFGVGRLRVAGTSALRDAENRDDFLKAAARLTGVEPEVLSGEEEARLSFLGATHDLPPGRYLVCDIGGGSTEFILGGPLGIEGRVSLDIGAVRLTERCLGSDPPAPEDLLILEGAVDLALEGAGAALAGATGARFVGVAGTVTSLGAMRLGLERYDPALTHHLHLERPAVDLLYRELAAMSAGERRQIQGLDPGRADVIVAGAAILAKSLARWAFHEVVVSERDILDGLVLEVLEDTGSRPGPD